MKQLKPTPRELWTHWTCFPLSRRIYFGIWDNIIGWYDAELILFGGIVVIIIIFRKRLYWWYSCQSIWMAKFNYCWQVHVLIWERPQLRNWQESVDSMVTTMVSMKFHWLQQPWCSWMVAQANGLCNRHWNWWMEVRRKGMTNPKLTNSIRSIAIGYFGVISERENTNYYYRGSPKPRTQTLSSCPGFISCFTSYLARPVDSIDNIYLESSL